MARQKRTFLVDPVSFGVFQVNKFNVKRNIIIMGELHDKETCKQSDRKDARFLYLNEFIPMYHNYIGKDKMLDIFLETSYVLPGMASAKDVSDYYDEFVRKKTIGLRYLRETFNRCTPKYDTSLLSHFKCPKNTRVHLCDVRLSDDPNMSSSDDSNEYACLLRQISELISDPPSSSFQLREFYEFIERFCYKKDSPQYHATIYRGIMQNMKLQRQLDNVRSARLRSYLVAWSKKTYNNKLRKLKNMFKKTKKFAGELKPLPWGFFPVSSKCLDAMNSLLRPLLDMTSTYMDLYLMARVFRVFADGTQPENVIIYAGQWHVDRYVELLEKIGTKTIIEPQKTGHFFKNNSCVDITDYMKILQRKKKS